jgi:glycosyltransferase involved in cell wall biosynthesis
VKKILLITPAQFGYHSGTYYFAKHLQSKFDVTVLGFYTGKKIISIDGIKIINISCKKSYFSKFKLIFEARKLHKINNYDFVFILYFLLSSLVTLVLPKTKIAVFINTIFIFKDNSIKEKLYNLMLKFEYNFFKYKTVISKNLGEYLKLQHFQVIPVGAEYPKILPQNRSYQQLKLIYVGTLYDRNIEITLKGIKMFLSDNKVINLKYFIIGFGTEQEVKNLTNEINKLNLNDSVFFLGEIRYPELTEYFLASNIGISFIPCTEKYDNQPPTKTFEYLAYGLPVIATKTKENSLIINDSNGVLIEDTPMGFCNGLMQILNKINNYNSNQIYESSYKYSWQNIVETILSPYILEAVDEN